jgi:hypothetical protein
MSLKIPVAEIGPQMSWVKTRKKGGLNPTGNGLENTLMPKR